jgi:hypothetical protein
MRALVHIWLLSIIAACGGGSGPAPQPAAQALSAVAPRADDTDLEVARVNGRPVWGSCVTAQAAHGAKSRQAALDECVAFELLAQTAEHKGLATDPMVTEATRSALVNRLIEIGFDARYQKPADLGEVMSKWVDQNERRRHQPELRASTYARINLAKDAPPELEDKAHKLADAIAAATAGETGMFPITLKEIADRVAAGTGFTPDVAEVPNRDHSGLDGSYGDALWAIPEVGRTSRAVRTPWGWDVILLTGIIPAKEMTRDELGAIVFDEVRRLTFTTWVNDLIKQLHVHVDVDQAQVAKLEGTP